MRLTLATALTIFSLTTGAVAATYEFVKWISPIEQSEPAPLASVDHVKKLETQTAQALGTVNKALKQTQYNQLQDHQDLNSQRLRATVRDLQQIQDELRHHPGDAVLLGAQAQDIQDLQDLQSDHKATRKAIQTFKF